MSALQKHRVLRQVIELADCRRDDAAALQAAASRLFQRDWLPLIERLCSAQGDGRHVLRIDRLQIDLGSVAAAQWLAAAAEAVPAGADAPDSAAVGLTHRLAAEFSRGLGAALQQAAVVRTEHELLDFYLHTGALPWWADVADVQAVARAAEALLAEGAATWRQLLGRDGAAAPAEAALRRLVSALSEERLVQLLARCGVPAAAPVSDAMGAAGGGPGRGAAPAVWTPALHPTWSQALDGAALALGQPARGWRQTWWREALAATLWPSGDAAHAWWPTVLRRWAAGLGLAEPGLRLALRRALDSAAAPADTALLAPLWQALAPALGGQASGDGGRGTGRGDDAGERGGAQAASRWWRALAQLAAAEAPHAARWRLLHDRLPPALERLPADLRRRVADALARADAGGPAAGLAGALEGLLQQAHAQGLVEAVWASAPAATGAGAAAAAPATPGRLADWAADWARALVPPASPPGRPHGGGPAAPTPASVEALYLSHAGLVLLWPFVHRFVERLGLLREGRPARWRDGAAAQRAAVLLQCAISGDAEPPEYQLPLAKLLCGLPLDQPLALDAPLAEAERAECEALLVAAIAQAPILRQMSVAGFRASFGCREGQLSARDGHWLLRVERQTFDVVLDRFPWSFALVRLPWMPTLLQVQW